MPIVIHLTENQPEKSDIGAVATTYYHEIMSVFGQRTIWEKNWDSTISFFMI